MLYCTHETRWPHARSPDAGRDALVGGAAHGGRRVGGEGGGLVWSASLVGVQVPRRRTGARSRPEGLAAVPLHRAAPRDPEAIDRWPPETYPAIARKARREKAEIYFWDESGFRADAVQGKTWGAKGQTPVVPVPGQRQGISAASAVNTKGAFWFVTYKERSEEHT